MNEQEIDARLARLKKLEYPVSTASGIALAALYFWWRLAYTHTVTTYTSIIAFLVGGAIPKFYFSVLETRLDRMRRELSEPPRAEVRAIGPGPGASPRRAAPAPAAPIQAVPLVEPPKPDPPGDPAAGPRFLS